MPANCGQKKLKENYTDDAWCSDKPAEMEGYPMKSWNIEIFLLDEQGNECKANCFTKAVYNLHPSFLKPVQSAYKVRIP